jgi:translation initiation factor 5B
MGLTTICKLEILPQYVFRNTKPAIFGVKVIGGKLTKDLSMIDDKDEKIGNIKNVQHENKSVDEATENQEVAISIPNINFERQLKNKKFLYTNLGETQFKNFKKNKDLLNGTEMQILKEIAEIKRKTQPEWGI